MIRWVGMTVLVVALGTGLAAAQGAARQKTVEGYAAAAEIETLAAAGVASPSAAPEAQALLAGLARASKVAVEAQFAGAFSRVEIVSPGFVLPQGTLLLHEAGARQYLIADPKANTYVLMDAETLVSAIEGSAEVVNSEYQARVQHTHEQREIAGKSCRKAVLMVTYASSIPFEATRIAVQQRNQVEIWHTPASVSTDALQHVFFEYRRDRTGQVQKIVERELGFPMEVRFVVQGAQAPAGAPPQRGSFALRVTRLDAMRFDPALFAIPPAGYRKLDRNPYFSGGATH